jgi:uncharacterized protein YjiS (DUF1127 family)
LQAMTKLAGKGNVATSEAHRCIFFAATSPRETVQIGHAAMSTIQGTPGPAPATAKRQVYSPFEIYWDAFQEWRKRQRSSATLCDLSDDIGTTRGEIDNVASNRLIDPRGTRSAK